MLIWASFGDDAEVRRGWREREKRNIVKQYSVEIPSTLHLNPHCPSSPLNP